MNITKNNHYVPELYLKNFTGSNGLLRRYRTLVPKSSVALWKPMSPGGVGYQQHLYTRNFPDGESDEIEKWLQSDFENPAKESIDRVASDRTLSKDDYRHLIRFAASQMVRTPAFFLRNRERWIREAEAQSQDSLLRLRTLLEERALPIALADTKPFPNAKYFPLKITQEKSDEPGKVAIRLETAVGRGHWMFAMRHILTETINKLPTTGWTIIHAHDDLPWFASDDPVVMFGFRSFDDYDFGTGWGQQNANIMLPLSPKHLLFTEVGSKRIQRGTVLDRQLSLFLRKLIAEHAHRYIFSQFEDETVPILRPRHVSLDAVLSEEQQWREWHSDQSACEQELW